MNADHRTHDEPWIARRSRRFVWYRSRNPFSSFPVAVCLIAGVLTSGFSAPEKAFDAQMVRMHLPTAALSAQPVGRMPGSTLLDLEITLPLRNRELLTNLLQQLYNPASPQFRRFLTPGEFAAQFGPTESDYRSVIDFAQASHLTVTCLHSNRTLLNARGRVDDIERAFHTVLRTYRHPTQ